MLFSKVGKLISGSSIPKEDEAGLGFKKQKEILPEPRVLGVWAGEVDAQEQSALLRLPAEIRNLIYRAVFTPGSRREEEGREERRVRELIEEVEREVERESEVEKVKKEKEKENTHDAETADQPTTPPPPPKKKIEMKPPPHPLALLLTCRKVSSDATLLAFALHPHLVALELTYYALRQRSLLLPPQSLAAIRSLAFAYTAKHYFGHTAYQVVADRLTNGALLSPSISTLSVRKTTRADDFVHRPDGYMEDHVESASCSAHIPTWFADVLRTMRHGRSYVWQVGEKWDVSYPATHLQRGTAVPCRGDCAALLHQEGSGRELLVKLEYVWDWDAVGRREIAGLNIRLVPGAEDRLPLEEVCGGTGFVWDPEGVYWEGLRKRRVRGAFGGVGGAAGTVWKGRWLRFVIGGSVCADAILEWIS